MAKAKTPIVWTNITAKLERVKPWEHNPKQISRDRAARLLKLWDDLGQFQTIAVGPSFELYDGHQRYNVLSAAHGLEIDVDMRQSSRPLTKKERERLIVESHATATGSFDWDMLANEFDPKDLEAYGLGKSIAREWKSDLANLEALVRSSKAVGESEPETDRAEELRVKWGVESGQLWQLGDHRLICGDCTDRAVVERVMDGERADCTITDPPYGVGVDYGSFIDALENVKGLIGRFMPIVLEYSPVALTPGVPAMWDYPRPAWVGTWVHPAPVGGCPWGFVGNNPILFYGKDPYLKSGKGRRPDSIVIASDRMGEDGHPTPKPQRVWEWLVERMTPEGHEIVYDPFSGSGTTLVACERLGRKCRAIEISPEYVALTLERWHMETGKNPKLIGRP